MTFRSLARAAQSSARSRSRAAAPWHRPQIEYRGVMMLRRWLVWALPFVPAIACSESESSDEHDPKPDAALDSASGGSSGSGGQAGSAGVAGDAAGDAAEDGSPALPRLGVFSVRVDGSDLKLLVDTDKRQLSHVRKGPGDWLTATRYNDDVDGNGLAMEGEGGPSPHYGNTEIVLFPRTNPALVTVVAGGTPDRLCANGSFTADGKLLYLHQDDPANPARPRFKRATFSALPNVQSTAVVEVPPELFPVDPYQTGPSDSAGVIVFPAVFQHSSGFMRPIWQMPAAGTTNLADVKVVGCPLCPANSGCCAFPTLDEVVGTNDPIIDPQGSRVAWMQQHPDVSLPLGTTKIYPYRQSVATFGKPQVDISPPSTPTTTIQSYMQWRPDGGELVYWEIQIDLSSVSVKQPLFKMAADGSGRQQIPLPADLCASHPSYLDADTIIFSGWRCGGSPCSCAAEKL